MTSIAGEMGDLAPQVPTTPLLTVVEVGFPKLHNHLTPIKTGVWLKQCSLLKKWRPG